MGDELKLSRTELEAAADALAHALGVGDRAEAFERLDAGEYRDNEAEITLSAFRRLLSDG
jgi:hypothetical protein